MNKYKKQYDDLIKFRLVNKISKEDCYCESHHIQPLKLGGNDNESNLVNLLPEEHFKAHVYLCQYLKSINDIEAYNKMLPVPIMMVGNHRYSLAAIIKNLEYFANIYSELRKDYAKYRSEHPTNKDKRFVHNNITNKNEMIAKNDPLPENYSEGWIYSDEYTKIHSTTRALLNKTNPPSKGKIRIYNLKTFETLQIPKNNPIPDGWAKGYKMNNSDKTIWINNPITRETKMIGENDLIPEGFVKGRGKFTEQQKKNYKGRIPWNKGVKAKDDLRIRNMYSK